MDWPVVLQTSSAVIGAATFVYGVGAWRRNVIGQKRIDLAVQTIVAFLDVQQAFREIRNPASTVGEGMSRQTRAGETKEDAEIGRMAFVAIERINNRSDRFITLSALRNQHQAYFGVAHIGPFKEVDAIRFEIFRAALRLENNWKKQAHHFRTEKDRDDHFRKTQESEEIFWDSYGELDPLNLRIEKMVADIEDFCREVIEPAPNFPAWIRYARKRSMRFWLSR